MGRGAPCEFASAPQDFSPAARSLWSSLWQLPQIKESDRLSVERLCRLEHEAASLRAELAKTGPILKRPVQNARGEIIAHETVPSPTLLPLRKIGSELAVLCEALGLTPAARRHLGLDVLPPALKPDELDQLKKKHAAKRGEADPGVDGRQAW